MAARILTRAEELILERGWTQGVMVDAEGRLCLAGALAAAWSELDDFEPHEAVEAIALIAEQLVREGVLSEDEVERMARFNDSPGRTAAEVCGVLRRAYQSAREHAGVVAVVAALLT